MNGNSLERTCALISRRISNPGVQSAFRAAAEGTHGINLAQETQTISQCFEKVNFFMAHPEKINSDFAGIQNTRKIINETPPIKQSTILNPFETPDDVRSWVHAFHTTIEMGNAEIGIEYRRPEEIRNGDPLSVFQWYLYDGAARMAAIHLGIPNNEQKSQMKAGDWIACALTEAAVVLAEEGDTHAKKVVRNMLDMKFIAKGSFPDSFVEQAQKAIMEF